MSTNRIDEMSERDAKHLLNVICNTFGIGGNARTPGAILTNVQNCKHFSELLHAVEREFFMVPDTPDEDSPEEEPMDECLVNSWGSSKEQYVEQFRNALCDIKLQADDTET